MLARITLTAAVVTAPATTTALSFNPLGDMANKLFGSSGAAAAAAASASSSPTAVLPDFTPLGSSVPSWDGLGAKLDTTPTAQRLAQEVEARQLGHGPPHTDAKLRLFGTTAEPRVTLYRDQAGWCPYCQKVWLLLEEKQVPYKIEKVPMRSYGDKPKWFLDKVPSGLLPVIELDGRMITESLVIMQILDETFPDRPLLPAADGELARANSLLKLERELFGWWCQLTFRPSGPFGGGSQQGFEECLDKVEAALGGADPSSPSSPWLLDVPHGGPSLVDLQYVSHVERMAASVLYWKGLDIRNQMDRWPRLERWFRAFESRPAYLATKSDYYTHVQDIPPQCGCLVSPFSFLFSSMVVVLLVAVAFIDQNHSCIILLFCRRLPFLSFSRRPGLQQRRIGGLRQEHRRTGRGLDAAAAAAHSRVLPGAVLPLHGRNRR